jgi:hypothetical protein
MLVFDYMIMLYDSFMLRD